MGGNLYPVLYGIFCSVQQLTFVGTEMDGETDLLNMGLSLRSLHYLPVSDDDDCTVTGFSI